MKIISDLTRRDFIQASSKTGTAVIVGTYAASNIIKGEEAPVLQPSAPAPNTAPSILKNEEPTIDPVRVAQIGVGTRGVSLLSTAASKKGCKIVAVCDVYQPHLENAVSLSNNPDVKSYSHYREMLNDPKIEAVIIATPDHWHEQMLIDCVAAGKDVYCEKGWTISIEAAKRMRKAVKDAKAVMQLGHQGRQCAAADIGRKMIEDGVIDNISLVNIGRMFNGTPEKAPWRWYGSYSNYERPDPAEVIKKLDWESWLGQCPKIDFNERHFWHWRCYWPYGTGQAGDLLSHEMDHVQSVLRYGIPDRCVTQGHNAFWKDDRETPDTWMSSYVFEKQNCTVIFEGSMNSRRSQTPEYIGRNGRMIFNNIGQDATMFEIFGDEASHRIAKHPRLEPSLLFSAKKEHRKPDHIQDFLNCVRTREQPQCNEDEAFIETAAIMMSIEAYRQKREVRWDPVKEEIV